MQKHIHCIIFSQLACLALQYISTFSHKQYDYRVCVCVIDHKMCVLIFFTTFVWNISHSEKNWVIYDKKNAFWSSRKVPVIRLILMKLESPAQIFKKYSNIKFYKNSSSRTRVVLCRQTDRWTDTTKLIVAFCNFVNVPKTCKKMVSVTCQTTNMYKRNFQTAS